MTQNFHVVFTNGKTKNLFDVTYVETELCHEFFFPNGFNSYPKQNVLNFVQFTEA